MDRAYALKPSRHKDGHPALSRAELPVDTVSLALYLIGKMLVREDGRRRRQRPHRRDHGECRRRRRGAPYRGMRPRNRSLFRERGDAYVYLIYGSAYMLNVASEIAGIGAGVLIRALEPRDGIPIMQRNRQIERLRDLARGPGRRVRSHLIILRARPMFMSGSLRLIKFIATTRAGDISTASKIEPDN
jgi:DNA-3-methyladenine glycosylase